jgi:hypothetical protein
MVNEVKELFDFIRTHDISVISGTSSSSSRAASSQEPRHDVRITEVVDGLIVTRPARKYTDLNNHQPKQQEQTKEEESEPPVVIELGGSSKAGSVSHRSSNVNEVKELFDFMRSNGRI